MVSQSSHGGCRWRIMISLPLKSSIILSQQQEEEEESRLTGCVSLCFPSIAHLRLEEAHHAGIQKLLAVEQATACKVDKVRTRRAPPGKEGRHQGPSSPRQVPL